MDRRERSPNQEELLRLAFRGMQARLWTSLPGIVDRFDAARMTVDVKPAINGRLRAPDGSVSSVEMPMLLDCPVLWQGGGGVTLTFPIAAGDECLVVFASRCIDAWWSQGGVQNAPDLRMHNLSDGFALVGVRSVPRSFAASTTEAVLRTDDGTAYFKLNPASKVFTMTAPGGINLNGVTIDPNGNMNSPGTITGQVDVFAGTKSGKTHTHPAGSPNTGQPNG